MPNILHQSVCYERLCHEISALCYAKNKQIRAFDELGTALATYTVYPYNHSTIRFAGVGPSAGDKPQVRDRCCGPTTVHAESSAMATSICVTE